MSKYTTEVRYVCEVESGLTESVGFTNVDDVIGKSWNKIFTSDVTIFDEDYRKVICSKILKHYYVREICCETVGLWKLWMNTRLEEIMPYYNQLYNSAKLEFDPFNDVNVKKTADSKGSTTSENSGESSTTSTKTSDTDGSKSGTTKDEITKNDNRTVTEKSEGSGKDIVTAGNTTNTTGSSTGSKAYNEIKKDAYSDTPQGTLSNVENLTYLTNYRNVQTDGTENTANEYKDTVTGSNNSTTTKSDTASKTTTDVGKETEIDNGSYNDKWGEDNTTKYNESGNSSGTGKSNSTENYIESIVGKQSAVSYSSRIKEFRETFLNIDMMVIEEFRDLFFGLW